MMPGHSQYKDKLSTSSDHELYLFAKRFLIQEYIGFTHNSWKLDLVWDECENRNSKIYESALADTESTIFSILEIYDNFIDFTMANMKVINIQRIDYMTPNELGKYLNPVSAGNGSPVVSEVSRGEVVQHIYNTLNSDNSFFCEVSGESMQEVNISDGSFLVVEKGVLAKDGDIVVATIDGELFVKRYTTNRSGIKLESASSKFPDIPINEFTDLNIWGVVRLSIQAH